jgi:dipeptidyl aminopeptidase/acylaminoacyl peptidase
LHGDLDQDVPFEQGLAIAERFARHGVYHEFIRVPNAGHNLFDTDNIEVVTALQQIGRFLLEQLTRK